MAELGSQFMNVDGVFKGPAKTYFSSRGIEHESFDLDGQFDSVALDLGVPLEAHSPYLAKYNLITNFGTTEHVVNHFTCFENIHGMCEPGGLMLHAVPSPGNWQHHGRYYYSQEFFRQLAAANDYNILFLEGIAHHKHAQRESTCALLTRGEREAFMSEADFLALPIVVEEDNPFVSAYLPKRSFLGRLRRLSSRLFGDEKYKL